MIKTIYICSYTVQYNELKINPSHCVLFLSFLFEGYSILKNDIFIKFNIYNELKINKCAIYFDTHFMI